MNEPGPCPLNAILYLDNTFQSPAGHNLGYLQTISAEVRRLASVAEGLDGGVGGVGGDGARESLLLANRTAVPGELPIAGVRVEPTFRVYHQLLFRNFRSLPVRVRVAAGLVLGNFDMFVNTVRRLCSRNSTVRRVVLLNTFPENSIGLGAAVWLTNRLRRRRIERVVLCVHNRPAEKSGRLFSVASRLLRDCTDARVVAHSPDNAALPGFTAELVPLPVSDLAHEPMKVPSGRVVVGVLGVSTYGKGFDVAVDAVQRLGDRGDIHFLIQSHPSDGRRETQGAADRLIARPSANLQVLQGSLSRDEYLGVVNACDVLVFAHRAEAYATDLSGVFFEGCSLGTSMIASNQTAMGKELSGHEFHKTFSDGDPASLAQAIGAAVDARQARLDDMAVERPLPNLLSDARWSRRSAAEIICSP